MSTLDLVQPRVLHVPEFESSLGREAIELAAMAGLDLDPWQQFVLERSLGEAKLERWAATEVGLVMPRQNGKDAVLEARELAGLFWFDEELIIHSAHHFKTVAEHFERLVQLIEACPDFSRRVRSVRRGHGEEGITLKGGQRIRFFTRTKGGGRGFSAPLVIFNEAMFLPESALGALLPTQAAMPNRQRWYAGSAVDQFVQTDGVVLARVRERALAGDDPRLAYFEWSLDVETPDQLDDEVAADPQAWAHANPGLGVRITPEAVEDELRSLDRRTFAVERLGVGDWPSTSSTRETVLDLEAWDALAEPGFRSDSLVPCLAFDVSPDGAFASIAAGFRCEDGPLLAELVRHQRGTRWLVDELVRLRDRHEPVAVLCGASSPAEAFVFRLEEAGLDVEVVATGDHAKACVLLASLVDEQGLRHLGSSEVRAALQGAARRPFGDGWLWSRKHSAVDISPLVASTLALWGQATLGDDGSDPVIY